MNVYYKIQKGRDGYAILYLFEWDQQFFPPHKWDYEPVIVFTDNKGNPREVYVDDLHYFVGRYILNSNNWWIDVNRPWRSMTVREGSVPKNYLPIFPRSKEGNLIRIKPLTRGKLEELKSRSENPLSINERILENLFSVRDATHWSTFHAPTLEDLARDFAKNYGLSRIIGEKPSVKLILTTTKLAMIIQDNYNKLKRILRKGRNGDLSVMKN